MVTSENYPVRMGKFLNIASDPLSQTDSTSRYTGVGIVACYLGDALSKPRHDSPGMPSVLRVVGKDAGQGSFFQARPPILQADLHHEHRKHEGGCRGDDRAQCRGELAQIERMSDPTIRSLGDQAPGLGKDAEAAAEISKTDDGPG